MLRRVLPVAGAAALALVPSAAWAAPDDAPDHYLYSSYFATAQAQLPDGRQVTASLSQYDGVAGADGRGFLYLQVGKPCVWPPFGGGACTPSAYASVDLTDEQVDFDRGLRSARVDDVTVTLASPPSYVYDTGLPPGSYTPPVLVPGTTKVVTVSLRFSGTGTVTRHAVHFVTDCGEASTGCQSTRLSAERAADVSVGFDWETGESAVAESDAGRLMYGQGIDAAAFPGATGGY